MQTLTLTKSAIRRNMVPALSGTGPAPIPAPKIPLQASDLEGAKAALREAERIIRAQEERISQLENMALTDELTGLLNRRGFMMALQRELAFANRDKDAGGILIMVDLDGFKSINDLWGHSAGDEYLQAVGQALVMEVRANDVVARLGGDEFAILMTRIDDETGLSRLARLDKSFNSRKMQWGEKILPLCGSFGMAVFDGSETAESVMAAADLKLYAHKARRRMRPV